MVNKQQDIPTCDSRQIKHAYKYLLRLAEIGIKFSEIQRYPVYADGHHENDAEHSYLLGLTATELAANYYPQLDTGLVAQFSLVHDLPEVHTGDVWTVNISDADRKKKEAAEIKATRRLLRELPPHIAKILKRYEDQQEPEARFVRFVDKLLPDVVRLVVRETSELIRDHGILSLDDYQAICEAHAKKLHVMFPEFEFIHLLKDLVTKTSTKLVRKSL